MSVPRRPPSAPASQRVADHLRAAILGGEIAPGRAGPPGGGRPAAGGEPAAGARGAAHARGRGADRARGQQGRPGAAAAPARGRRHLPDARAARAAGAGREPAAAHRRARSTSSSELQERDRGRRRHRPVPRAGPGVPPRHLRRLPRSSSCRRRSSGCGTPPSTTGGRSCSSPGRGRTWVVNAEHRLLLDASGAGTRSTPGATWPATSAAPASSCHHPASGGLRSGGAARAGATSAGSRLRCPSGGASVEVEAGPDTPLLYVLRNELGLMGARFGCGLGLCGACFVHSTAPWWPPATLHCGRRGQGRRHRRGPGARRRAAPGAAGDAGRAGRPVRVLRDRVIMTGRGAAGALAAPRRGEVAEALERNLCRCGAQRRMVAPSGRGRWGRANRQACPRTPAHGWTRLTARRAAQGPGRQPACWPGGSGSCRRPDRRPGRQGRARPGHPHRAGPAGRRRARTPTSPTSGCWAPTRPPGRTRADRRQPVDLDRGPALRAAARQRAGPVRDRGGRAGGSTRAPSPSTPDASAGRTGSTARTGSWPARWTWRCRPTPACRCGPGGASPAPTCRASTCRTRSPGGPGTSQDLRLPGQWFARVLRPPSPGGPAARASTRAWSATGSPVVRDGSFLAWPVRTRPRCCGRPSGCGPRRSWAESGHPAGRGRPGRLPAGRPARDDRGRRRRCQRRHRHRGRRCPARRWRRPTAGRSSRTPRSRRAARRALAAGRHGCRSGRTARASATWLRAIAGALGLDPATVHVRHVEGAGCYGHNAADDVAFDAVLVARAVPGTPVQVLWSRQDELSWAPFSSAMVADAAAQWTPPAGWPRGATTSRARATAPGPGTPASPGLLAATTLAQPAPYPAAADPPTRPTAAAAPATRVPRYDLPQPVRHRSPAARDADPHVGDALARRATSTSSRSSRSMDEVAAAAGADPLEFRLAHLSDERGPRVLRRPPRPPAGAARGPRAPATASASRATRAPAPSAPWSPRSRRRPRSACAGSTVAVDVGRVGEPGRRRATRSRAARCRRRAGR